MKRLCAILLLALLTGCATYSYPLKDGGDGVYYAESPPEYSYVYGSYYPFTYGYYGYYGCPWGPSWNDPVWYSPVAYRSNYWHCPGSLWADPFFRTGGHLVYFNGPYSQKYRAKRLQPVGPVDLQRSPGFPPTYRVQDKPTAYGSSEMKNRAYAKSYGAGQSARSHKSYNPSSRSYSTARQSAPARAQSPRAPSRAPSARQQTIRHISENKN